ncbi:DUF5820 family protein [Natrialbaceae archaeon A-gly3]
MSEFTDLPEGWVVWSDAEDGRAVLVYRPDVFDAEEFPAPCLPTLYLTRGKRTRRPGRNPGNPDADWHVDLYLEPDVSIPGTHRFPTREEAVDCAIELAQRFADGEIDYRGHYQVPRERYFDRLDELTGRTDENGSDE